LERVSVAYSDRPALEDIFFQLRKGGRVAVVKITQPAVVHPFTIHIA